MGNIGRAAHRYDVLPLGLLTTQSLQASRPQAEPLRATDPSPSVPAPEPMPAPYPEPSPEPSPTSQFPRAFTAG